MSVKSKIQEARDLLKKYAPKVSSVANIIPAVNAYNSVKKMATPQYRQNFGSNLNNLYQSVLKATPAYQSSKAMLTPTGVKPLDYVSARLGNYVKNNYYQPMSDLPSNIKTISNKNATLGQRGLATFNTAMTPLYALPDPTDALMGVLNLGKGYRASKIRGGNLLQNIDTGLKSASWENYQGLGSAVTKNPTAESILNMAELPALLLMGGLRVKGGRTALNNAEALAKAKNVAQQPLTDVKTKLSPEALEFEKEMLKKADDLNKKVFEVGKFNESQNMGVPKIETTEQSKAIAEIESVAGGSGKKTGFKALGEDIKTEFQGWVNTRRSVELERALKQKEFSDLDAKGVQGMMEFQAGSTKGRYKELRDYLDKRYNEVTKAGIPLNYKENYLTQIWKNSDDEIAQVFGRKLGLRPSFTLPQIIQSYKKGIEAGLTPRYTSLSQIAGWYEGKVVKALADNKFFKYLSEKNYIVPSSKAPEGWVTLNPDRFPKRLSITSEGKYGGTYSAPPDLAKTINNYLGGASFEGLAKWADRFSTIKNRVLSFGIPGTAINAHGFNILTRNILASKNPIEGAITGIKYMIYPNSAAKSLDKNLAKAPYAVRSGLTLSANEYKSLFEVPEVMNMRGKFGKAWNTVFEKGLFDKMLPSLKLQKFYEVFEGYKKSGMDEKTAAKNAAVFTNDVFGGINWEELGKSKDWQNFLRVTILAPDWFQTNIRLAGKLPTSFFKGKAAAPYRKFATTFMGVYATMNAVNKLSSGHWCFQNDPGHAFEIEAGYTNDGQKRYIRPFQTAIDFLKLPVDVAIALAKGDVSVIGRIVRNRLSIPLGVGVGMLTDTDYAGQQIGYRGTDKYGNYMPVKQRVFGIGGELGTLLGMPAFAKQGLDIASGKTGVEQGVLQGLELPFRYSGGKTAKAYNKLKQMEPEERNMALKSLKKGNPSLYKSVTQMAVDNKLKTTQKERNIRTMTIQDGERAKRIIKEIDKKNTREEKIELIKDWKAKGIITESVEKQLKQAVARGILSIKTEETKKVANNPLKVKEVSAAETEDKYKFRSVYSNGYDQMKVYIQMPDGSEKQYGPMSVQKATAMEARLRKIIDRYAKGVVQQPLVKEVQAKSDWESGYTRSKIPDQYKPLIEQSGNENGVHPALIAAILFQESGFNPNAKNTDDNGIAQINRKYHPEVTIEQARDPNFAIPYMGRLLAKYIKQAGSVKLGVAAYNVGPGRVGQGGGRNAEGLGPLGEKYLAGVSANLSPELASELGLK